MIKRRQAHAAGLRKLARTRTRARNIFCSLGPSLYNRFGMLEPNKILQGDSIAILTKSEPGWVDLAFADPPFNIGYLYDGYDDRKQYDEYLEFSRRWMTAVHRALKPTGSFYLAIGDEYAAELCVMARRDIGFHMRNWIIWHYTFGQQVKFKFSRSHTHILYFTKNPKVFTFNSDAVRVPSARQTTYADRRANPKGKLPDDVWFLRPQQAPEAYFASNSDSWHVSRVCGTFKEREGWHGCQMPIEVLKRIILASSNPNDLVLDPFSGSGTTVVAAATLGRRYIGIDQSADYVDFANKRLDHALGQMRSGIDATGESTPIDGALMAISDPKRASRMFADTDAFGRPRVARGSTKTA